MKTGNPMTKTPGEYEPPKQISKAEREARKAFRQVDAAKAMSEHALAEKAFSRNRERLKAERLAREAALSQLLYFVYLQTPFTRGEDGIQGIPQGYLFGVLNLA